MALTTLPRNAKPIQVSTELILAGNVNRVNKRKKQAIVLDEEAFVDDLDHIIKRDYFPALAPMQRLLTDRRQTRNHHAGGASSGMTGRSMNSSFEDTPYNENADNAEHALERRSRSNSTATPRTGTAEVANKPTKRTDLKLNQYLATYTNEDNAAFDKLMEESEKKRKEKVFWIEETAKQAANHIIDKVTNPNQAGLIDSWTYKVKNALMFVPDGDHVLQDVDREVVVNKPIAVIENTRFPGGFFDKPTDEDEMKLAMSERLHDEEGTPMIGGYKLLRTPSIEPGRGGTGGQTPFMTWGDIAGTPIHLTEEDDEDPKKRQGEGSGFRVPAACSHRAVSIVQVPTTLPQTYCYPHSLS